MVSLLTQQQSLSLVSLPSKLSTFTHCFYFSLPALNFKSSYLFHFLLALVVETTPSLWTLQSISHSLKVKVIPHWFVLLTSCLKFKFFLHPCLHLTFSPPLLSWVTWNCLHLSSWLYLPCFSSSAFGVLLYLSFWLPGFIFWHLPLLEKLIQVI